MKRTVTMLILIMTIVTHNKSAAQTNQKTKKHHYEFMLSPISILENDTIVSMYEVISTYKIPNRSPRRDKLLKQQLLKTQLELSKLEAKIKLLDAQRLKESNTILKESANRFNISIDSIEHLSSTKKQEEYLENLNQKLYVIKQDNIYNIEKKAIGVGIYLGLHLEVFGRELSQYYENNYSLELGYGISYKELVWDFHLNYGKLEKKETERAKYFGIKSKVDKTELGTALAYNLYDTHKWRISPTIRYDYAIIAGLLDDRNTDNIYAFNKISAGVDIDYILSRRLCLRPGQLLSGKEIEDISIRGKFNIGYMELPHNARGCLVEFGLVFNIYGRLIN
ncbi:hypothetical protein OAT16_07330 [Prolixibacteraceae bacterium]|nr:hypothetical protein [Prolixibacteraceae bacterium]